MNAAARSLSSGTWFRGNVKQTVMTKEGVLAFALLFAVLISALMVVYTKNEHRVYFSQLEMAREEASQLELEKNQLMLEKSAMSSPVRIQNVARSKLQLAMPKSDQVILVQTNAVR